MVVVGNMVRKQHFESKIVILSQSCYPQGSPTVSHSHVNIQYITMFTSMFLCFGYGEVKNSL